MKSDIAKILLEIQAVSLSADPPFTWASGRKSPIYCDNRLLMSYPEHRSTVSKSLERLIEEKGWRPEVIAGTATAGIPHAAWLAQRLDLPMVYVRGAAKGHGKQNRIEGRLDKGAKVVLIEDLISTGGSSIEAAQGVIDAGGELLGVAAIFTYGLDKAAKVFSETKIPCAALTDFPSLLEAAVSMGVVDEGSKQILASWREDPAAWSVQRGGAG